MAAVRSTSWLCVPVSYGHKFPRVVSDGYLLFESVQPLVVLRQFGHRLPGQEDFHPRHLAHCLLHGCFYPLPSSKLSSDGVVKGPLLLAALMAPPRGVVCVFEELLNLPSFVHMPKHNYVCTLS